MPAGPISWTPDHVLQALDRLKARARLVLAATLGLALLVAPPRDTPFVALLGLFFAVYFFYAGFILLFPEQFASRAARAAGVVGDAAAFVFVLFFAPSNPMAFVLFFVYFALLTGLWRGWWAAAGLGLAAGVAHQFVVAPGGALELRGWSALPRESWAAVAGLLAGGALIGLLAQRERRHLQRGAVLEKYAQLLRFDSGWPELWRRWLAALCRRFRARRVLLAYRDPESDRVLLWDFSLHDNGDRIEEADRPPRDARAFLLDAESLTLQGRGLGAGGGRWQVGQGAAGDAREKNFELPTRFAEEFAPRSLVSVPLAVGGRWTARLFLLDAEGGDFEPAALDELRQLVSGLEPVLANLLTVRSLVAQKVDDERERISLHLHDGVAQTLASVTMQLEVFRRQMADDPARAAEGLARLQAAVRQEQEELRRFLRTLKPVRVPAAELGGWVLAHCAQFQQETGIEVDVEAEEVETTLPEGVCRELFQILREALHNVRKHARARHVLVRLRQDDACLRLLVDDDGQGFPFAGSFSQRALEEQGLAPASIADRTRALGGSLAIDSTPGSGASVRVEIPLS